MQKYCEHCGNELKEGSKFCEHCGSPIEKRTYIENKEHKEKSKKKAVLIAIAIIAASVICVLFFIVPPILTKIQNTKEVEQIEKLIYHLSDKEITVDSENELNSVMDEYQKLSDEQQKQVSNYDILENAYSELQAAKAHEADQNEAKRVENLIESLSKKDITVNSEHDISSVQEEYDALSDEQKKLVTNYDKLEGVYDDLESALEKQAEELEKKAEEQKKKQANADVVIKAIEQIDESSLSAYDVSVEKVRAQYEALADDEKTLVTNIDKLERCEQAVESQRTVQYNTWVDLYTNLTSFEGRWGDFGAHVDYYQGIVEQAIKNTLSMSDYFIGNPDDVRIQVYFEGQPKYLSEVDPVCFVRLSGTKGFSPEDLAQGVPGTLGFMIEGSINVDINGNVIFEIYNMQEVG